MSAYDKKETTIIHQNPWYIYKKDVYEKPNGQPGDYYHIETLGASMIIALDQDSKILVVCQFRYLYGRYFIELPCGGRKKTQTFLQAAKAELEEETGFQGQDLKEIAQFVPYNGIAQDTCHLFLAANLIHAKQKLDDTEKMTVLHKSWAEIENMIKFGEIEDGMTLAALQIYRSKIINN